MGGREDDGTGEEFRAGGSEIRDGVGKFTPSRVHHSGVPTFP